MPPVQRCMHVSTPGPALCEVLQLLPQRQALQLSLVRQLHPRVYHAWSLLQTARRVIMDARAHCLMKTHMNVPPLKRAPECQRNGSKKVSLPKRHANGSLKTSTSALGSWTLMVSSPNWACTCCPCTGTDSITLSSLHTVRPLCATWHVVARISPDCS